MRTEVFYIIIEPVFSTAINKLDLAFRMIFLKAIELNDFFEEYMKEDQELNAIRELERYKEMFK